MYHYHFSIDQNNSYYCLFYPPPDLVQRGAAARVRHPPGALVQVHPPQLAVAPPRHHPHLLHLRHPLHGAEVDIDI